jgi:hypothetical protein
LEGGIFKIGKPDITFIREMRVGTKPHEGKIRQVPTAEILSGINARPWISIVLYLKK